MAYEYEKENIRKLKSYNVLSGGANITKPIDEIQEVYRKAKAFDEIYKFLSNSPIKPFFKEYLERMANELERADDEKI
jgi:hypothetical protein